MYYEDERYLIVGYDNGKRTPIHYFQFFKDAMHSVEYRKLDHDYITIEDCSFGDKEIYRFDHPDFLQEQRDANLYKGAN